MQLTILGNNSALPNHNRFPTAQVLAVGNELVLIDCGEGTQVRMQSNKIRSNKISKIFISHLHGDHYFGLIGLLTRYSLNNRTEPIDLFGPEKLIEIIQFQLSVSASVLSYDLIFHPVNLAADETSKVIWQQKNLKVTAFPTVHRIECYGYKFEEIRDERKLIFEELEQRNIPKEKYKEIKEGFDYFDPASQQVIPNEWLTILTRNRSTYVFAADTRYTENFLDIIRDCDLLYHETTYLRDHAQLAFDRYHSTSEDAAKIALKAGAKSLLIGHFSSKYANLRDFETECSAIFKSSFLSFEGMIINI